MTRLPNWRRDLNAVRSANRLRPHVWGGWDCCLWPADGVKAMTGEDFAAGLRGTYDDRESAYAVLRAAYGAASPAGVARKLFGNRRHPAFARDGDLVLHRGSLGLMNGSDGEFVGSLNFNGRLMGEGLVLIPRAELEACWHV